MVATLKIYRHLSDSIFKQDDYDIGWFHKCARTQGSGLTNMVCVAQLNEQY